MKIKIRILGSGTSTGVPEIGCTCPVCTSSDARDHRLRTSALLEVNGTRLLMDCGPDFRQQMLPLPFKKLDAVLVTHDHYDHVSGLDDLRPFSRLSEIPIYVRPNVAEQLRIRMPYCFVDQTYPGAPKIFLKEILTYQPFAIGGVSIMPLTVMHGKAKILGYRIGNLGYITDMSSMPDESYELLKGLEVLIMNALRIEPHPTHQNLEEAIEAAQRIGAKKTYFIHMAHHIGLHAEVEQSLPNNIHLAYDGLVIE